LEFDIPCGLIFVSTLKRFNTINMWWIIVQDGLKMIPCRLFWKKIASFTMQTRFLMHSIIVTIHFSITVSEVVASKTHFKEFLALLPIPKF